MRGPDYPTQRGERSYEQDPPQASAQAQEVIRDHYLAGTEPAPHERVRRLRFQRVRTVALDIQFVHVSTPINPNESPPCRTTPTRCRRPSQWRGPGANFDPWAREKEKELSYDEG